MLICKLESKDQINSAKRERAFAAKCKYFFVLAVVVSVAALLGAQTSMTYPDRTHGISEGPGTTVHLYHLLARYLAEHFPAGPR